MAANTRDAVSAGHTEGPWGIEDCGYTLWVGPMRTDGFKVDGVVVSLPTGDEYRQEFQERQAANARLISAACNSYDRQCGERAIEAAEADLLGKALEALREIRLANPMNINGAIESSTWTKIDAILSQEVK